MIGEDSLDQELTTSRASENRRSLCGKRSLRMKRETLGGECIKLCQRISRRKLNLCALKNQMGRIKKPLRRFLSMMIRGLLPDDREEVDTLEQQEVRGMATAESIGVDEEEFTEGELTWAVNQMKDKRASGLDGI